jgi:hypothetical protein
LCIIFYQKNGLGYILGYFFTNPSGHPGTLLSPTCQGCQMVSFQTKNTNLGKFWRALNGKMLIYFRAIWNILRIFGIYILWPFGTFCVHLVHFFWIWYHVPRKIWQPCYLPSILVIWQPYPFIKWCGISLAGQFRYRYSPSPVQTQKRGTESRVARFFLVLYTKAGKMYQISTKCTKWS